MCSYWEEEQGDDESQKLAMFPLCLIGDEWIGRERSIKSNTNKSDNESKHFTHKLEQKEKKHEHRIKQMKLGYNILKIRAG